MALGKKTKILKLVLINLAVFVALAEFISVSVYFFKHGALFYFHQKRAEPPAMERAEPRAQQGKQLTNKRVHPFFGYTYTAGLTNTNNYGFNCPHNLPLKKENPNWYIIGIFGGSVADDFYRDGSERLAEQLKKKPAFAEKEIVFLNFAVGGYKQPQQLQILAYFLSIGQEFDLVLNIDGFNEVVFCANNTRLNVDMAMPSAQHFLPMRDLVDKNAMTGEKLEIAYHIRQLRKRIAGLDEKIKVTPLASFYWLNSALRHNACKEYRSEITRFDGLIKAAKGSPKDSLLNIKHTPFNPDQKKMFAAISRFWARCSLSMHTLQKGWGGSYLHVLQPNQYHTGKTLTETEQKHALDDRLPYSFLVKKGYPVLREAIELLREKNINAADGTTVFDKVKETVYTDKCCHFNAKGSQMLADFIAGLVK